MKKAVGILALSVLYCLTGYTQNNEWIAELQKEGVEVYYKVQQCNEQEVVLLKVINTNGYQIKIQWADKLELEGAPAVRSDWRGDGSGISTLELNAGETIAATCDMENNTQMIVVPGNMSSLAPMPVQEYHMENTIINKQ